MSLNGWDVSVIPSGGPQTNCLRLALLLPAFFSIDARVVGKHREHGVPAALTPENLAPETVRIGSEDVRRSRGQDDPRALCELALQLAGAPAGISGEDTNAPQVADLIRVLDLGGQEADAVDD